MIQVIPNLLEPKHIEMIIPHAVTQHHEEEEGNHSVEVIPYLTWVSDLLTYEFKFKGPHIPNFIRVSDRIKVFRLKKGMHVPIHTDNDYQGDEEHEIAKLSILIKLNDNYLGGETRFRGIFTPDIPVGGGLIFHHHIPHEGLAVLSGEKLVLKTDIFVKSEVEIKSSGRFK